MGLVLFGVLVLGGFVGAGVAIATYASISQGLPQPSALEQIQLPEQSVVYDRDDAIDDFGFCRHRKDSREDPHHRAHGKPLPQRLARPFPSSRLAAQNVCPTEK